MGVIQKRFSVSKLVATLKTYQDLVKEFDTGKEDGDDFYEQMEYQIEQADECVLESLIEVFLQIQEYRGWIEGGKLTDFKGDLEALIEKYAENR